MSYRLRPCSSPRHTQHFSHKADGHPAPTFTKIGLAVGHRRTVNVILTDDVTGTGYRGEYVEIRGGFMRNFLFPAKRAIYATEENKLAYESVDRVSTTVYYRGTYGYSTSRMRRGVGCGFTVVSTGMCDMLRGNCGSFVGKQKDYGTTSVPLTHPIFVSIRYHSGRFGCREARLLIVVRTCRVVRN